MRTVLFELLMEVARRGDWWRRECGKMTVRAQAAKLAWNLISAMAPREAPPGTCHFSRSPSPLMTQLNQYGGAKGCQAHSGSEAYKVRFFAFGES